MLRYVIYTDLDGTLLDQETYSHMRAEPALSLIRDGEIPLVFCTAKTRAEVEVLRDELDIHDPFIPENGGAIFIPDGYFDFPIEGEVRDYYHVIELGTPYPELREVLGEIKKSTNCKIKGFGDITPEELSEDSKLTPEAADRAQKREYDEAFKIQGDEKEIDKALRMIQDLGYECTAGERYLHISKGNDKSKAIKMLTEFYRKKFPGEEIKTIGLGNSPIDFPMFRNVDIPILIRNSDGSYAEFNGDIRKSLYEGPRGWNEEILKILRRWSP